MALEFIDLSISLPGRVLMSGFTAQVRGGEVLAVMGESGSGKTTLLNWAAGLLGEPFSATGRLVLDGRDITECPLEARHIGLLFQDDLLFPHWNVLDNLLFALPAGDARERRVRAEGALDTAGLGGFGARMPDSLSGGQRARVSLLRSLLAEPRAVLLDEPFSKLDAALRSRTRDWVFDLLRQRGIPALLVTHDPADVPPAAKRLLLESQHA